MKRLPDIAIFALTLALVVLFSSFVAYAADTAPETVAQATSETTKVTWAYGAVIQQWASALSAVAMVAITWLLRNLPTQVYSILVSARVDQLLKKSVDYGINMVAGAAKDRSLTVDVQNEVLARAIQYVIDNAPKWLQSWMGGPEQIANKIIARLDIPADSPPIDVKAVLSHVKT